VADDVEELRGTGGGGGVVESRGSTFPGGLVNSFLVAEGVLPARSDRTVDADMPALPIRVVTVVAVCLLYACGGGCVIVCLA